MLYGKRRPSDKLSFLSPIFSSCQPRSRSASRAYNTITYGSAIGQIEWGREREALIIAVYLVLRHARRRSHESSVKRRWGRRWYAVDSAASPKREGPVATCCPYASSYHHQSQSWSGCCTRRAGFTVKLASRARLKRVSRARVLVLSHYVLSSSSPVFHRHDRASLIVSSRRTPPTSGNSHLSWVVAVYFYIPSISAPV